MMETLEEKGVLGRSLIVVCSDHGQLLGEHGRIDHGTYLYDELLKVPLLIKYPYEVEHVEDDSRYVSLVKLKELILGVVEGKLRDDSILYDDVVFSESHGIIHRIPGEKGPSTEEERRNIEELEKYRIAVYRAGFKGIFNVTDWRFEEITSEGGAEITDDVEEELKREVLKFLKTVSVAKIPKIKISTM